MKGFEEGTCFRFDRKTDPTRCLQQAPFRHKWVSRPYQCQSSGRHVSPGCRRGYLQRPSSHSTVTKPSIHQENISLNTYGATKDFKAHEAKLPGERTSSGPGGLGDPSQQNGLRQHALASARTRTEQVSTQLKGLTVYKACAQRTVEFN